MPGKIIRYTANQLLHLQDSPLVEKPLWLPSMEQLMKKETKIQLSSLEDLVTTLQEQRQFANSIKSLQQKIEDQKDIVMPCIHESRNMARRLVGNYTKALEDIDRIVKHLSESTRIRDKRCGGLLTARGVQPFNAIVSLSMCGEKERIDKITAGTLEDSIYGSLGEWHIEMGKTNDSYQSHLDLFREFDERANEYQSSFREFSEAMNRLMVAIANGDSCTTDYNLPHLRQTFETVTLRNNLLKDTLESLDEKVDDFVERIQRLLLEETRPAVQLATTCDEARRMYRAYQETEIEEKIDGDLWLTKEEDGGQNEDEDSDAADEKSTTLDTESESEEEAYMVV
ncbi:hypothetical protein HDK90DRAFT_511082 [Phyllosticta capitalensis]|uniref:Uncharacterized protein n=1 Tax=Phyllosticta capitalensis TaxID=121624 RepID=A0ABR1YRA7_9PEZI